MFTVEVAHLEMAFETIAENNRTLCVGIVSQTSFNTFIRMWFATTVRLDQTFVRFTPK